jgi:hypothetical protein
MAIVPTISFAQSSGQPSTDKTPSLEKDVSKWTRKEWNAAKAEWVKEREKWNSCNKEAKDKKLRGRKSRSFIYNCMSEPRLKLRLTILYVFLRYGL